MDGRASCLLGCLVYCAGCVCAGDRDVSALEDVPIAIVHLVGQPVDDGNRMTFRGGFANAFAVDASRLMTCAHCVVPRSDDWVELRLLDGLGVLRPVATAETFNWHRFDPVDVTFQWDKDHPDLPDDWSVLAAPPGVTFDQHFQIDTSRPVDVGDRVYISTKRIDPTTTRMKIDGPIATTVLIGKVFRAYNGDTGEYPPESFLFVRRCDRLPDDLSGTSGSPAFVWDKCRHEWVLIGAHIGQVDAKSDFWGRRHRLMIINRNFGPYSTPAHH